MKQYNLNTIATIRSCYKEKFGIPRQPGLVATPAKIEFDFHLAVKPYGILPIVIHPFFLFYTFFITFIPLFYPWSNI